MEHNGIPQMIQQFHGNMTIQVSKDYSWKIMMWESDISRIRRGQHFTTSSDYEPTFETVEVTKEELFDYINKGYAIKINC